MNTTILRKIVILLFLISTISFSQFEISFKHLTVEDGLSNNEISAIIQDPMGFLWIGTSNGLNRYDGNKVNLYKSKGDSVSLPSNNIICLHVDSQSKLWIGTSNGIASYDYFLDEFFVYSLGEIDSTHNEALRVTGIQSDSRENIYIVTGNGVVYKFDQSSSSFNKFQAENFTPANIKSFLIDSDDVMWLGGNNGLFSIDLNSLDTYHESFEIFDQSNMVSYSFITSLIEVKDEVWASTISKGIFKIQKSNRQYELFQGNFDFHSQIVSMYYDEFRNVVWLGTYASLTKYDFVNNYLTDYFHYDQNPYSKNGGAVTAIFVDKQQNLWIGSPPEGCSIGFTYKDFHHFTTAASNYPVLSQKPVTALLLDSTNKLWVGYGNSGLDVIDYEAEDRIYFSSDEKTNLGGFAIFKIFESSDGTIWVGNYNHGLHKYLPETQSFQNFQHDPNNANSVSANDIRDIAEDKEGNLWLATHGGGLDKFDPKTNTFTHFKSTYMPETNAIIHDWLTCVEIDSSGFIWIGTVGGVTWYDPFENIFHSYLHGSDRPSGSEVINDIFIASDKSVWVATDKGLNLFDKKGDRFIHYDDFLTDDQKEVTNILECKKGNLWVTTARNIIRFNYETREFDYYDKYDGVFANGFNVRSSATRGDGYLLFGGNDGIVIFKPSEIVQNKTSPPVYISNVIINNKDIFFKDVCETNSNIFDSGSIVLEPDHKVLTLEFSVLNYKVSEKNRYKYKLEPFEKEWIDSNEKRQVTYTNLNPGKYIFKVIAANNDGVWNEKGAQLLITVKPEFVQSIWFKLIIFATAFGLILTVYLVRTQTLTHRNEELEYINNALKNEMHERQLYEEQLQNSLEEKEVLLKEIHHRVKNNLQIIQSLINLQKEKITDTASLDAFEDIKKRIMSMALVHQKMYQTENFSQINIKDYITSMSDELFSSYEFRGNVELELDIQDVLIDLENAIPCGLMINELVTNSLKHAFPDNQAGKINISLKLLEENLYELIVQDNGVGLKSDLDLENPESLGMTLIQILTHQLDGKLDVTSDNGSQFSIQFYL